jgi:hypothetical protein
MSTVQEAIASTQFQDYEMSDKHRRLLWPGSRGGQAASRLCADMPRL